MVCFFTSSVCLSSDFELTRSFVQSLLVARLLVCMFMRDNYEEIMSVVLLSQKYAGELDCALVLFTGSSVCPSSQW